ncbi:unnamed protein product [Rhizophagus irregularis]|nr:unnamed protein product [Rhizophagus irregularis]CAB5374107.1 unnamed protein product [Rhizophagus irregularis]
MPKRINNQENKNHKFLPYLVKDFNCDGQYIIITFYLSEGSFVVLSDFVFPTVEQVLKQCKKSAKRAPNSFIIFRMFFNQSVKYVPPSNVGRVSQIAKSVWAVVSEDLKKAFILLEGKVKDCLRKTRAPSFIMHHGNDRNRKIRRFSTSSFSSHELNEPLNKNTPSLDFNNITTTSELPESYAYNYEPPTFPPFMPFMENFQEFEVPAESSKDPNSLQFTLPEHLLRFTTSNWNPPGIYFENLELLNIFVNDTNTAINYNDSTMTNETFLYDRETTAGTFMRNDQIDQIDQIGQIGQIGQTHVEISSDDTFDFTEFCSLLDYEEICNLDFGYCNRQF